MSRIGKKPITIPKGVTVKVLDNAVDVQGPKGKLRQAHPSGIRFEMSDGHLQARTATDDPAVFQYTSGTTRALPEAVRHTHRAVVTLMVAALYGVGLERGDRYFCPSSPAWGHGLWHGTIAPLALGIAVGALAGRFDPARFAAALDAFAITNVAAAPTVYRMARAAGWTPTRGRIAKCSFTGEPMDAATREFLADSLGVAPCKVVAKVASDARKPGGLVVIPSGREAAFLAPLAVRRLPGVGPKAEERLRAAGIETVGDLAALTDEELRRLLPGSVGAMLRDRARGIDPRALELDTERISISVENTFERDIADRERLHDELRGMAAEVATALQRHGQVARTVTTKFRYADFSIRSRSTSLEAGIDEPETIADLACRLLDRGLRDRPGALRLVGVGVSSLADFRQLSLEAV